MPINSPKLFCLGLSRTGTMASSYALDNLGIPTLHYSLEAFVQKAKIDEISIFLSLNLDKEKLNCKNVTIFIDSLISGKFLDAPICNKNHIINKDCFIGIVRKAI